MQLLEVEKKHQASNESNELRMGGSQCLNLAVIGVGKKVCEDHLPAIHASNRFDLVALCDSNLDVAQRIGDELNIPASESVEEMIGSADIDAALVAVPHYAYPRIIEALVSNGIHVLKEKPLATSLDEAQELKGIVDANEAVVMLALQRRFHPIFQSFLQLRRHIGRAYSLSGKYTMNIPRLDLGWRALKRKAGGGALIDMGYHYIDVLVWYFGLPATVSARMLHGSRHNQSYDVEDTVHLLLDFQAEDGHELAGSFLVSRAYPKKSEHLNVVGTHGSVTLERGRIVRSTPDGELLESLERVGDWQSAFLDQLDHFYDVITKKAPQSVDDFERHFMHVAVVEAAYISAATKTSVSPRKLLEERNINV